MHVGGQGDPLNSRKPCMRVGLESNTLCRASSRTDRATLDMDTAAIDAALGPRAASTRRGYQFNIPALNRFRRRAWPFHRRMGTAIAINSSPRARQGAITAISCCSQGGQPGAQALPNNGIEVTALHSHMIDDSTAIYFSCTFGPMMSR